MLRIARLELQVGVGLDYADRWLRARPLRRSPGGYRVCWGCEATIYSYYGSWTTGRRRYDPELEERLCSQCIELAHAELEVL